MQMVNKLPIKIDELCRIDWKNKWCLSKHENMFERSREKKIDLKNEKNEISMEFWIIF